ncbi:regulatory protein for cyclic-di-GMP, EAL domain protein [Psychromonas ingrahamii 37]|uniref:Regulatory protein for cyclic-di-GMP, EAL domain protein n=1 Tax=Psychromonas ingrahamii (strain DSM 17664 / CCUG 51855 / 37) TaxID=357804 RepID=A1SS74_PSYIN|nr:EAL domain-containing response regulator [Psychromonas ingrahamii]ABM02339.1 regulatory protein for cyclic-di-GMP, EAL domain protein [Psychromonas ingrahamii 37]
MVSKSSLNILIIDDQPFMLKLLEHMLISLGFNQPTIYDNGKKALASLDSASSQTNLILLDLNMPEMDGIEVVRHLAGKSYSGSIILVSGEDARMLQSVERLVRAHNIPLLGSLQKPINPKDLSILIDSWEPPSYVNPPAVKKIYGADDVRAAIVNHQLVNYYQPKVDVANGKVMGVETLVRWRHPQDGLVFPDQFIGVAEDNGLINDLTREVISDAFSQTKIWLDAGLSLRVAVNLSMENLDSLEFTDYVTTAAATAGIIPDDIVLEVTESRLIKSLTTPMEVLTRLRLKRFHLSIDDFGTGHSSLMQLLDLPFNELKVDQGFVHGAASNEKLCSIYNASLSLAQQLGMKSVAEGVEDQADWDFIRSSGCDLAQGYYIAKPMPADEIHDWIIKWEANRVNLITPYD